MQTCVLDLVHVSTKIKLRLLLLQVAERIAQLQEALLHCGKFQDALEPLLSWLRDTEELVANQKPPSAEYRVVKAQIQEQKVQGGQKMLTHTAVIQDTYMETRLKVTSVFQIPLFRSPTTPHTYKYTCTHTRAHTRVHSLSAVNFPGSQPAELMLCQSKHMST